MIGVNSVTFTALVSERFSPSVSLRTSNMCRGLQVVSGVVEVGEERASYYTAAGADVFWIDLRRGRRRGQLVLVLQHSQ